MPPFALAPSSGRSSRYRRRIVPPLSSSPDHHNQSSYSNSAVAAAELAASSIAISAGDNISNSANAVNNASTLPKPSVLQNLRASRARLMQRNSYQYREQRFFKIKLICFGVIFFVGLVVIGKGGGEDSHYKNNNSHYLTEDQRNLNHYKGGNNKSGNNDIRNNVKLSVPPPPSQTRGQNNKHDNLHKKHSENKSPPRIQINNDSSSNKSNQNEAALSDKSSSNNKIINLQRTIPHVIPPILTFTYHTNLLTTPKSDLSDSEDVALSHNVQQITSLHPESTVHFLNDQDCLASIIDTLGPDTNLTKYFTQETHGMYKADICRGAALYQTGGLYFDIDVETRGIPLWDVIAPMTEFVTVLVHEDSNHLGGFFQAFIGVVPRHPVMKRYLELFVEYYEGRVKVEGPLGVHFLRMAYDEVISKEDQENKTELWQEIRYSPKQFPEVTRSRWGKRRACQMLVVAPPMKEKKNDITFGFERKERVIPIFSHANGSRMCGGKDTNRNGNSDTA